MHWSDGLGIVIGCVFLFLVLKSIMNHAGRSSEEPLRGKQRAAQEWLEANEYKILKVRERGRWVGYYDDKAFEKQLIADFVVRHNGKLYAVKVMNNREQTVNGLRLRDQWFPLYTAFGVDGVLQIDLEDDKVHVVDFAIKSPSYAVWRRITNRTLWFLSGVVLALAWLHGK